MLQLCANPFISFLSKPINQHVNLCKYIDVPVRSGCEEGGPRCRHGAGGNLNSGYFGI